MNPDDVKLLQGKNEGTNRVKNAPSTLSLRRKAISQGLKRPRKRPVTMTAIDAIVNIIMCWHRQMTNSEDRVVVEVHHASNLICCGKRRAIRRRWHDIVNPDRAGACGSAPANGTRMVSPGSRIPERALVALPMERSKTASKVIKEQLSRLIGVEPTLAISTN